MKTTVEWGLFIAILIAALVDVLLLDCSIICIFVLSLSYIVILECMSQSLFSSSASLLLFCIPTLLLHPSHSLSVSVCSPLLICIQFLQLFSLFHAHFIIHIMLCFIAGPSGCLNTCKHICTYILRRTFDNQAYGKRSHEVVHPIWVEPSSY